jgi:hypothetical protein
MLLAVALQIVGAALVVIAVCLVVGAPYGLGVAGVVLFVAGYAHERDADVRE